MIAFIEQHLWQIGIAVIVLLPIVKIFTGIAAGAPPKDNDHRGH